ncbi:MAG: 1-(5-phosphoribosyl)-5-[(5-phosphoribosylamino)methylideneamino]imidazole-4-carboxamide isomerase [Cyclobacteriaceae bacterium]
MHIIPAIDLIDGKCVRLEKGDYSKKKEYHEDPVAVASSFEQAGIKRLHLVDLDGAKAKHVVNLDVLNRIAESTALTIDFGGGVKSDQDIQQVFANGASQVTGGSIAAKDKTVFSRWIDTYGPEKVILGADVLNEEVMVSGWQEGSSLELMSFLKYYVGQGITYVICTDISKDGMMAGPSFDLYQKIMNQFPAIKLIASGGVTTITDLERLREMNMYGAIVGKAIYEGSINLDQLSKF